MAKKPEPRKIPVRKDLLTSEERDALKTQARESVLEEMKQDARDAYFAEQMRLIRRENIPADQLLHLTINIAPFLPYIMLDGVQYFHGYAYDVPHHQALVIYEQMQRSWQHQDEIEGRSKFNQYRRPQNRVIGPSQEGTTTRGANGPIIAEI